MKEIYKTASSSDETGGFHCAFSNPGHMRLKWQMAEIQLCWLCLDSGGGRYSRVQGVVRLEWEVLRKRFIFSCWDEAYFCNFTIKIYCFWGFLLHYSHFSKLWGKTHPSSGGERNHKGNLDDRSLQVYLAKRFEKAGSKTWINASNVLRAEINLLCR